MIDGQGHFYAQLTKLPFWQNDSCIIDQDVNMGEVFLLLKPCTLTKAANSSIDFFFDKSREKDLTVPPYNWVISSTASSFLS